MHQSVWWGQETWKCFVVSKFIDGIADDGDDGLNQGGVELVILGNLFPGRGLKEIDGAVREKGKMS